MPVGEIAMLHLVLTRACNLRCRYCYQRGAPPGRMPWETLRCALDWARSAGRRGIEIVFSGGEPLLELPLLQRAVAYASARRAPGPPPRYVLLTNGMLLDARAIGFLAGHDFDLQLSFDGVRSVQEQRAPGTFAVLDARLDRLLTGWTDYAREHLTVGMIVTPATIESFAESVGCLLERGVPRIALAPVHGAAGDEPFDAELLASQFERIEGAARARFARDGEIPLLFLRGGATPSTPPPECGPTCGAAPALQPAVDVDGRVYPCALLIAPMLSTAAPWLRDEARRLCIGDVSDPELEFRREAFVAGAADAPLLTGRERRHSGRARCAACAWLGSCGVCPVAGAWTSRSDDPDRVPDFLCAFARQAVSAQQRFTAAVGAPAPRTEAPDRMARFLGVAELPPALRRVRAFMPAGRDRRPAPDPAPDPALANPHRDE
jgi:uncharacterized protein